MSAWPEGLEAGVRYRLRCDMNRSAGAPQLVVLVDSQGDAHVSMPGGGVGLGHGIRVCTGQGGGRNRRTRAALLQLANAIRLDNQENGETE